MKKISFIITILIAAIPAFAQQKNFEGAVTYKVNIQSKTEGISEKGWKASIPVSDTEIILIKNENTKRIFNDTEEYYNPKDKKTYIRYKGIDTLYYVDDEGYTAGNVTKQTITRDIAGYKCQSVIIKTSKGTNTYFYAPVLHLAPDISKLKTDDPYTMYIQATGAVYLSLTSEFQPFNYTETAIKVETKQIDDHEFELPSLPVRPSRAFIAATPPVYKGGEKAWLKYLESNLDPKVAAKYVKLRKGETSASEVVKMRFIVTEKGEIISVQAANAGEVNPKLVEEATRVIKASPHWTPAVQFGQKIFYSCEQDVVFVATKE